MSDSVRPHRRQPTRFLCPWDSLGKNTGVGCHFLLHTFSQTLVIFKNYIAVDVKQYFTVVLIFIFLMINGIEKIFMSLLDVCISSIKTFFVKVFVHFFCFFFIIVEFYEY